MVGAMLRDAVQRTQLDEVDATPDCWTKRRMAVETTLIGTRGLVGEEFRMQRKRRTLKV